MLVGTFEVEVSGFREAALKEHCFMGDAGIKPDVKDIGDFFVLIGFSAE